MLSPGAFDLASKMDPISLKGENGLPCFRTVIGSHSLTIDPPRKYLLVFVIIPDSPIFVTCFRLWYFRDCCGAEKQRKSRLGRAQNHA